MKSYYITILLSVSLGAVAQLFLKLSSKDMNSIVGIIPKYKSLLMVPYFWGGLICYGLSLLFWLDALSKMELSRAYPLVSLGYIASLLLGYFFLEESITLNKVIGILLIMSGVVFIAK